MRILLEGAKYPIGLLKEVFEDPKFFIQDGLYGTVNSVGYYYSFNNNVVVYMLPKVFADARGEVFGFVPEELFVKDLRMEFKHATDNLWMRQLLIYFYNSLSEFRTRYRYSGLVEYSETFELNSNLGYSEYSYIDLLLTFVNFYKKNRNTILYRHIEYKSSLARNPKWDKTIRISVPLIVRNVPIYVEIRNKAKIANDSEELLCYYFSILNHFNEEHNLSLKIDPSFNIVTGSKFRALQNNGLSKLRKIKYRYFSDIMKRIYRLCELYFSKTDNSSCLRKIEEFISVRNYNIVFEDMIDKIFSDEVSDEAISDVSLEKLKFNADGKIIDHIFSHDSLLDTSKIFYIGDSKYYKPTHEAGRLSIYKQFTYAKNVIQFNIDLLNNGRSYNNVKYRDLLTEGYNISPNFFVYGSISDLRNFDEPNLKKTGYPKYSYHFEDRLFDRDSLFVLQYSINFLFVLKAYTSSDLVSVQKFRGTTRQMFREHFLNFFNSSEECPFSIFQKRFNSEDDLKMFVNSNFKLLNGKCFSTDENVLLIAKHKNIAHSDFDVITQDFNHKILS